MPRKIQGAWWLDGGLNLTIIVFDVKRIAHLQCNTVCGNKN